VPGNNGLLYVGGGDGVLYALNAENGTVAWQVRLTTKSQWPTPVLTPAITSDGSVYAGASGPIGPTQLYRVSPDGRVVWRLEVPNALESSAVLDRGDTAFITVGHVLQAIAPDGRALWSAAARGWLAIPFLLPDRSIGLADGERLAILSRAGKQIAQQAHASGVWVVDDTTALFGRGGQLTLATQMQRVVAAADTLPAWRDVWHYNPVRIDDHEYIAGVALMAGGSVVVSTQSRVVVLRVGDGLPIAEYVPGPRPGPYNTNRMPYLSAPVLGVNGTIYVAGTDQSLYAVRDTLTR
jgi:outer membrane protein assembly factor BamB